MGILFSCRPNCTIVIVTKLVHGTIALKVVAYKDVVAIWLLLKELFQRPPLLRWINLNSNMDKLLQPLQNVDWIYLNFVKGIPRSTVDSLHEGPVMREALPFNDVIMKLCKCVQASLNIDRRWLHVISPNSHQHFEAQWSIYQPINPRFRLENTTTRLDDHGESVAFAQHRTTC